MKPEGVVSQCTWLPIFCYHHDHHDHHDRHDNLVPSECPGAKLHNAGLLVEREVGHIYRTGRLQKIVLIMMFYYLLSLYWLLFLRLLLSFDWGGSSSKGRRHIWEKRIF